MDSRKTLLCIRHCKATGQEPDAPLTPAGKQAAVALTSFLAARGVDELVSSPYMRAVDTLRPYAESRGLCIRIDDRLRERRFPAAGSDDWMAALRASFEDYDARLPGDESSREAQARGVAALCEAARTSAALPAACTHGNLLTLILASVDPKCGFDHWKILSNPDVYELHFENVRPVGFQRLRIDP